MCWWLERTGRHRYDTCTTWLTWLLVPCTHTLTVFTYKIRGLKKAPSCYWLNLWPYKCSVHRKAFWSLSAVRADTPNSHILKINDILYILKALTSFSLVPGKHISQPVSMARTNSACLPVWASLDPRPGQRSDNQSSSTPHLSPSFPDFLFDDFFFPVCFSLFH